MKVRHVTDRCSASRVARVPKADGGPFEFAVDTKTHKVDPIGIPHLAFCE